MDINYRKVMDPGFPLLTKFKELAPGTFKHCQSVSILCENIASELDLNVDLLTCASLYHDIGKINNPLYFSENQPNSNNPIDDITPFMAYQIITRHIGDGIIYLLQEPEIPKEIIPIIMQHHGDSVLRSIYSKVKNEPEDYYRYKCKKPESTEAAILMIIDSVEATSRSLAISNEKKTIIIDKAINGTIDRLIDDGQIDILKIGVLKVIKKVLVKELESIYHKRVSYERDEDDKTIGEIKDK